MKNFRVIILITTILLFSINFVNAATITSTATGGAWATAGTWIGGVAPGTTDTVIIATTGINSVIGTTATIARLTVNSGSILTLGTAQLTISGFVVNNGTITASTGRIMQTGGIGDFTNTGVITFTGAGRIYFSGNMTNTGTLTLGASNVRFYGTDAVSYNVDGFTTTGVVSLRRTAGTVTFTGNVSGSGLEINGNGGTLNLGAGLTHTFSGAWTRTAGTLNGGSSILKLGGSISGTTGTFVAGTGTVEYNGTIQTCAVVVYNNLTLSNTSVKTFSTAPTVGGILSMEGTATISRVPTYTTAATLQYNTATPRTSGVEWPATFTGSGGVIIANTGTITISAAKVFGANTNVPLTINSGATLTTNNLGLTFHGDFINNGTLNAGSSPIVITGTTATQDIAGFTTTGLTSMTKASGTATLTGNVSGAGLTLNGTAGVLNLGTGLTHTFTGTWTRTNGTLDGASSTLRLGSTVTNTAGTFTASTGTVEYFAAATQTVAPLTYNNLTLSGTSLKTTTSVTVNGILSMEGTATASTLPTYGSSATLQYKGSAIQTTGTEFPTTWSGSGGIKIENANGVTLTGAKDIGANPLYIGSVVSSSIFADGGFTITSTGTLNLVSGTYTITSSSMPAFTSSNIYLGTTVNYAKAGAQTIKADDYANLTISGAGTNSKVADGDISISEILNLQSANASATQGCLSMSSFTLNMGATATTAGTGDVTGIVKRTHTFTDNIQYSFGNQFTNITFMGVSGSVKPAWISCKITIGTAPSWRAVAVKRIYTFAQDGTGTDQVLTNLHYLDSELNTATQTPYEPDEAQLVLWDGHGGTPWTTNHPHGKSNNDATNNWIGRSGFAISYLAVATLDDRQWGFSYSNTIKNTWLGNSTSWSEASNWSSGHTPLTSEDILIPGSLSFYPTLTLAVEVKTLEIAAGASLNAGSYGITINGSIGAWLNNGTFNGNTGSVVFSNGTISNIVSMSGTGTNNFNNITINATTYLQPSSGIYIKIAGAVTVGSGAIVDLKATTNTVEYNGASQTILNLQGPASDIGYSTLVINSSGTTTLPATLNVMHNFTLTAGTAAATAASSIDILGNVTLTAGTFDASSSSISVGGNWTNNGTSFTAGTSTVTFNNISSSQMINGTAASQTFNAITVAKTAQTLTVGGSTTTINTKDFTISSGTFAVGTATNINVTGNWSNLGTFTAGSGTVAFNGASAQTISGTSTFNNLTVNNASGVSAIANQTVNGVLNLQSANASATQGTLEMGANELTMGATATTTGAGDVTGIVTRNTFSLNTPYSFGNQFTTINLSNFGTLPTSISVKIILTSTHTWKTDAINRYYDIIQSGAPTTKITLNLHYLSSELNGATEDNMSLFDYHVSAAGVHDHGSSEYNSTEKWVGLSNLSLTYIAKTAFDQKYITIGTSTSGNDCTWLGISSGNNTDWNDAGNWTGGVPTNLSHVHIPITTNDPILPAGTTTISYISIDSGGVLNTIPSGNDTIIMEGSSGAWNNHGTFNAGNSTVIFTNAAATMADPTDFYNVTIADGASLTLELDNTMRIAGALSLSNTGILDAASHQNIVEYNGADQTIVFPNGSTTGYHNLILSGSGIKTMPSYPLNLHGEFTISGTVSVTAASDITVNGIHSDFTIGSGSTFNASSYTILVAGDWINNGTFNAGTSTVILNGASAQIIDGTDTFNNLTINSVGVTSNADQFVNGILNLQSANASAIKGALDMANQSKLILGINASTTGIGDVTGIVKREHIFTAGILYSFNHQFTTILFAPGGTFPSAIEVKVQIGSAPSWKTGAVKRIDDWIRTGGSGCYATIASHYLDSELNGNSEQSLSRFKNNGVSTVEVGHSAYNSTDNWVANSNIDVVVKINTAYGWQRTYANSEVASLTWNGSLDSDFSNQNNWTPNSTPITTSNLIIPDASLTPNDPLLSVGQTINTLSIQNGGIFTSGNVTLTIAGTTGAMENAGTFNAGTGTVIFTGNGADLSGTTDFYNLTINENARLATQSGAVIGIAGTVTINGTGGTRGVWSTVVSGVTTINYNGGDQTIVIPDASTNRYSSLILSGTGTKTLPSTNLNIAGNIEITGATTIAHNEGTISMVGTTENQTITYSSSSGSLTLKNLVLNNTFAGGKITLNSPATIAGELTLTKGTLMTDATNILTISASGSATAGNSTSFVDGPMIKLGTGDFTFPVGNGSKYARIGIVGASGDGFKAEYIKSANSNCNGTLTGTITKVSQLENWDLHPVNSSAITALTLYFDDTVSSGIENHHLLRVAHWTGSEWEDLGRGTYGINSITTQTAPTTFSPFTLGTEDNQSNMLPVELLSFTSNCREGRVELLWKTASESNSDYFNLEKSVDAINFKIVQKIKASGYSNTAKEYLAIDPENAEGTVYYRLSEVDFDGTVNMYKTISTSCKPTSTLTIQVSPNPFSEHFTIQIDSEFKASAKIVLLASDGTLVYTRDENLEYNSNDIEISTRDLKPGFYTLLVYLDGKSLVKKLIKY